MVTVLLAVWVKAGTPRSTVVLAGGEFVHLGELGGRGGKADFESFGLAGPAELLGLGDAVAEAAVAASHCRGGSRNRGRWSANPGADSHSGCGQHPAEGRVTRSAALAVASDHRYIRAVAAGDEEDDTRDPDVTGNERAPVNEPKLREGYGLTTHACPLPLHEGQVSVRG